MLYVIVGIIIVVAASVIYGSFMRRRIFKQIDRFESWKIDVMNRPITEQISKVKELRMIGETEKKFEIWRNDWDEIITTELPLVEEKLFDAEELADKFRFKQAQAVVNDIQKSLEEMEAQISRMLNDLNQVVDSEKQNREDIVAVKEQFHSLKKVLITKTPQFKEAGTYLETSLGLIETDLSHYEQHTNEGNVIKAREILVQIKEQLESLAIKFEEIPNCYKDINTVLPKQIADIETGITDMINEGYSLDHLNIFEQITQVRKHLQLFEEALKKGEIQEVKEGLQNTFEQMDWIYNRLEKEVESRKQLREDAPIVRRDLEIVGEKIKEIKEETEIVKQGYRIEAEDLKTQSEIDRTFEKLEKEFNEVDKVLTEKQQAFSIIHEKVEDMRTHIDALRDSAEQFKEMLTNLRKDELLAKETLRELRSTLFESRRKIRKGNLPGIPNFYVTIVEDGEEILGEVSQQLDKKPLAMHTIHQLLDEAREKITIVNEKTDELVESAILTEQLIQYGNRFRSHYPQLDEALREAEAYFRSYNYSEAVEVAAAAIYKIDPGIVKRFKVEIEEVV